ncbi:hypothetical protein [Sphingomonas sp. 10B4]|uniref:hypothetical protein n=1 Tax=Sphingomonas sp. 10B4 TaxID=3048575 RepID=UPI002AB5B2FB|nr:hypothetical protein [Sphingomonas sp. 10B4]MDY7525434.1 hypothetical protein [Sphingomonas sp. 10B4]MEB0281379.1 hypothetical protein [Sphingomonas sp. 10B4]
MKALLLLAPLVIAAAPQATPVPPAQPLASVDGLPIGAIPKQDLPARGCAAYLWTASGTRALIAMVGADPARLRVSVQGKVTDLDRSAQTGASGFGFPERAEYGGGPLVAKLTMKVETRESISGGAVVPEGLLEIDQAGQDTIIVPVAGLIGCT